MPIYTPEQARTLKKISQKKMAEKLGISENSYINKEKGVTRFYVDEALAFCKIVDMALDNIIFFKSDVP